MKKILFLLSFVLLLLSLFICYWLYLPLSDQSSVSPFVVNQGDSLKNISLRLYQNKFTKHPSAFLVYAYISGKTKGIKAGGFRLDSADNLSQILDKLTTGGSQDFWLKIIPGQRTEEISSKFTFPKDVEGYLLPDSYLIPDYFDVQDTINLINKNFDQKTSELNISTDNISQIVTIASLLEREAKTKTDRQMVAGIINNRLSIGMPLQIDATVQYVRDSKTSPAKYWRPLLKDDLKLVSPFNTYLNPGLPPGPICNPSVDSLFAAANPIPSDYVYYIHGNDGTMHYAKTLDQHNANVAKYLR